MFSESKVTEIYCMVDDFCKEFVLQQEKFMIEDKKTRHRNKPNRMSDAEIMVVLILFHSGGFRCFKHYYKEYVCKHLKHLFPRQVSYNRFVELEKEVLLPMTIFIKKVLLGTCTGISFVDSTPLRVCRNQRILIHKTFEGLAERGKCSMGWFFGFKLHLIINDKGEILNFMFTPGNVDDREPLKQGKFVENIKGKLCADKGYIGQALFENLFLNGIQLVTKVKSNMKNSLMSIADKILLRKRALIETVNDELKNIAQIEHSRHRSFNNFIANSLSLFLDDAQIETVKDVMTYNVVKVTYDAQCDMIPTLKDEEKKQILAWLKEAREYAIDAESSKKKHETFGKYKGRINNYLSKRGYNLQKEREEWAKRVKARGGTL